MRTKIVTADVACNQISSWLQNGGYRYEDLRLTMDCYECAVQMSSYKVKIMFDCQKQLYSFEMLNGKVKTSFMFKELKEKFDTYYHINMVIVPTSKRVADHYENVLGIKTVFDNFVGHIKTGYTVKFKELGTEYTGLRVKEVTNELYHVAYVSYSSDGSYEIIRENDYDVTAKECTLIENEEKEEDNLYEESYAHEGSDVVPREQEFLASLDNGADAIFKNNALIYRSSGVTLIFKQIDEHIILVRGNSGLSYITHVEVFGGNLEELCKYSISLAEWRPVPILSELNTDMLEGEKLILGDNIYPLGSFRELLTITDVTDDDKCIAIKDISSLKAFISTHCPPSSVAVTMSKLFDSEDDIDVPEILEAPEPEVSSVARVIQSNVEKLSGDEDFFEGVLMEDSASGSCEGTDSDCNGSEDADAEVISGEADSEVIASESVDSEVVVGVEEAKEPADNTTLPVPVSDGVDTNVKLVVSGDKVLYVLFSHGEDLYNVPVELAEKCGLVVDMIMDRTEASVKGGICMTDEERKLHKFAKRLTDEELIWKLIYNLFNY